MVLKPLPRCSMIKNAIELGEKSYIYCTQLVHLEVTKLLCPHHEGAGCPHPVREGGPDLWYQMALVDTTVERSLVSSAEGTREA